MAGQQDVFAGLWHWAVSCGAYQDRAVHLRGTGNHVFDVIGVAWAVNVRVVTRCRFVLDVGGVNRDTARFFFRCCIDLVVCFSFAAEFLRQNRCDCSGQRGFTVVDVADGADVDVRLGPFEFTFCHFELLMI